MGDRAFLPSFWVEFTMLSNQHDSITDPSGSGLQPVGTLLGQRLPLSLLCLVRWRGQEVRPGSGDTQEAGEWPVSTSTCERVHSSNSPGSLLSQSTCKEHVATRMQRRPGSSPQSPRSRAFQELSGLRAERQERSGR